jgi:hypothetical protein
MQLRSEAEDLPAGGTGIWHCPPRPPHFKKLMGGSGGFARLEDGAAAGSALLSWGRDGDIVRRQWDSTSMMTAGCL